MAPSVILGIDEDATRKTTPNCSMRDFEYGKIYQTDTSIVNTKSTINYKPQPLTTFKLASAKFIICVLLIVVPISLTIFPRSHTIQDLYQGISSPNEFGSGFTSTVFSTSKQRFMTQRRKEIYDIWTEMYGLEYDEPPQNGTNQVYRQFHIPSPPHLQNCVALTNQRKDIEDYSSKKEYPPWAIDNAAVGVSPPWVKGHDANNLPYTRIAQRDIWVNQHPLDCLDPQTKFIVVGWVPMIGYGAGSQLHIMATFLSLALVTNRVLVPLPGSYQRGLGHNCKGDDKGSLSCYFFPITSKECEDEAMGLHRSGKFSEYRFVNEENFNKIIADDARLLILNADAYKYFFFMRNYENCKHWPRYHVSPLGRTVNNVSFIIEPWSESKNIMNVVTEDFEVTRDVKFDNWMMSQMVRYMLRWPSLRLCHLLNRVRQKSYGYTMIDKYYSGYFDQNHKDTSYNASEETNGESSNHIFKQTVLDTPPEEGKDAIPRPIVSMHVREGDKASEMKLFSMDVYLRLAQKLRLLHPELRDVWLSTESQEVVDEAKKISSWKFYFTNVSRQVGSAPLHQFELNIGREVMNDNAFANLIVSSQCDYFIGSLGSNWNRLINELRLTSGHAGVQYLSLNGCKMDAIC